MSKIKDIKGYEILDSRGNPTIMVEIELEDGTKERAGVPSGASTGKREALELRDGDKKRYNGKGVLKAVNNINTIIRDNIIGIDADNQELIDAKLNYLDGTSDKSNLGANAILGVSLATLRASSKSNNLELYKYVGKGETLPKCMMNILNGGAHADNKLDFQEFMIVPFKENYQDNIQMASEIFHKLKETLKEKGLSCGVGDEGGFAPDIESNHKALDLIMDGINKAGYKAGKDVYLALDVAASEFYKKGKYHFDNKEYTSDEMIDYFQELIKKYPIISIEDALSEDDYNGFVKLTKALGDKVMLVGDDLFVTNINLLNKGIDMGMCNAILIKPNQIGTITETLSTIKRAKKCGYKTIISHRSGETTDTSIADLAVGLDLGFIKTGSISRGERICKYNRLSYINNQIRQEK